MLNTSKAFHPQNFAYFETIFAYFESRATGSFVCDAHPSCHALSHALYEGKTESAVTPVTTFTN